MDPNQNTDYGLAPNMTPMARKPQGPNAIPNIGSMSAYQANQPTNPTQGQPTMGDQPSLQGGYTPQQAPPGGQDYMSFLTRMSAKKAF